MNEVQTNWMDAKAAAEYIGRHSKNAYKTLLRLAREGKIRAGYDGKTFRFSSTDLDAWMYTNAKKIRGQANAA